MSNELQLVLEKDITELTPKVIPWNHEQIMAGVKAKLELYDNIMYSDDQIGEAKKDKAQLNNFCTVLNAERIRIGKVYGEPYEKFKKQVDEVIAEVKTVSGKIDEQVRTYDEKIKNEKREKIKEYFDEVIGDYKDVISFEKIFQAKWLNATVKVATAQADIEAIIENVNHALIAIEALDSPDEDVVKAYYFMTLDLSAALTENARLQREREDIARLKALREEREKAAEEQKQQSKAVKVVPMSPAVAEISPGTPAVEYLVKFSVTATIEDFKKLKAFLIENGIKYQAIKED